MLSLIEPVPIKGGWMYQIVDENYHTHCSVVDRSGRDKKEVQAAGVDHVQKLNRRRKRL